jgi:hypothetical protein
MANDDIQRITPYVADVAESAFIGNAKFGACFSSCGLHRYTLWRRFAEFCELSDMVAFIGLNPSTADERVNDPTVNRCINFAKRWGFRGMIMLNIFAYRSTDPRRLRTVLNPYGPENDCALKHVVSRAGKTVCAWGTHGELLQRGAEVERMLFDLPGFDLGRRKLFHLGLTKHGFPRHPLYVHGETELSVLPAVQHV